MTVCIATDGFPPQTGGIATFNKHLVALLLNAGHRVIVLYPGYDANTAEKDTITTDGLLTKVILKKTYFSFREQWQPYFKPGGFDAPNWIAIGLAMREWLLSNHKKWDIDVIEASDYGGCGIFLCDINLPPVVITGHGSLLQLSRYNDNIPDDSYKVVKWLEEASFKNAAAVIAHSPVNQLDLERTIQRKIEFARIPWSNDQKHFATQQTVPGKLVIVGGLHPVKGVFELAEAMKLLLAEGIDLKIDWIGVDTWLAPGHQKMSVYLANKYPGVWQKTFVWHNENSFEETTKTLAAAEIVIIPSVFETFNYVALEAASMGKPIIITEETGASYLFTSRKDAWIIPANNPAAITDAIIYLTENKTISHNLGIEAATIIKKVFIDEQVVTDRLNIYKPVIKQHQPSSEANKKLLDFLNNYRTPSRKLYYRLRSFLKKILFLR